MDITFGKKKKKKPVGRPKLSRDLLRWKKIQISFKPSEFEDLERASKNYEVSTYARNKILEGVKKDLKGGR